jgi:hypothetical protein
MLCEENNNMFLCLSFLWKILVCIRKERVKKMAKHKTAYCFYTSVKFVSDEKHTQTHSHTHTPLSGNTHPLTHLQTRIWVIYHLGLIAFFPINILSHSFSFIVSKLTQIQTENREDFLSNFGGRESTRERER